jgi:hypothetical protein
VPAVARSADDGDNINACNVTVTAAFALSEVSATLVAVTVCEPATDGAVYRPLELIVPDVVFPPLRPSTDHVTDVFVDPFTEAVNCVVAPAATFTEVWLRATVMVVLGVGLEEMEPHPTKPNVNANREHCRYRLDEEKLIRDQYPLRELIFG